MNSPKPGAALRPESAGSNEADTALRNEILAHIDLCQQLLSADTLSIIRPSLEMEYQTLRGEVLKRIELRQQLISITLTIAGVFFAVGLTAASIALVYPPLAAFLAIGWIQNDHAIRTVATHIRERQERMLPGLAWETKQQQKRAGWRYVVMSHGSIFIFTQLLAVFIGVVNFTNTSAEYILLVADALAMLYVWWIIRTKT